MLPPFFLVLAFVSESVFKAWWKVMLPVGIFFLIWIINSPVLPQGMAADRTATTDLLVKIFVAISAVVIGWKYWQLRKK